MRLAIWLALIQLGPALVLAQHGAWGRARSGHDPISSPPAHRPGELGIPPLHPIPSVGPSFVAAPARPFSPPFGFYGFPLMGGYEPPPPTVQNVIVVAQPAPPAPVRAPEIEPARSSIREYTWTGKNTSMLPAAESPRFAIVLRDGSVHDATAIWSQGDRVGFVDMQGRHNRLRLADIDHESTARLNRTRGLKLQVPPPLD